MLVKLYNQNYDLLEYRFPMNYVFRVKSVVSKIPGYASEPGSWYNFEMLFKQFYML